MDALRNPAIAHNCCLPPVVTGGLDPFGFASGYSAGFMAGMQMAMMQHVFQQFAMLAQLGPMLQMLMGGCGCGPRPHCLPKIKGGVKGKWLVSHGDYKKNKDGSYTITKGQYAGYDAKRVGKGRFLLTQNGIPRGMYCAPGGHDKIASPLTFDLNGDGVRTTNVAGGRQFDINGDGKVDQTAWAAKGDGVLAFDGDGDGKVGEDGTELFGNNTKINGQGGFSNGFEALKALAAKHLGPQAVADGKLDAGEIKALEEKVSLSMLVDGERKSLSELGITELKLGYIEAGQNADIQGNEHRQVGAGFVMNGQNHAVNDVWFKYQ